jgi:hypothetical protein
MAAYGVKEAPHDVALGVDPKGRGVRGSARDVDGGEVGLVCGTAADNANGKQQGEAGSEARGPFKEDGELLASTSDPRCSIVTEIQAAQESELHKTFSSSVVAILCRFRTNTISLSGAQGPFCGTILLGIFLHVSPHLMTQRRSLSTLAVGVFCLPQKRRQSGRETVSMK